MPHVSASPDSHELLELIETEPGRGHRLGVGELREPGRVAVAERLADQQAQVQGGGVAANVGVATTV